MNAARIVVYTGDLSYSVRKGIVAIDEAVDGLSWLVVLHAPRRDPRRLLRSQRLNLRRHGWRWIPYQAADVWRRVTRRRGAESPGGALSSAAVAARPNLRLLRVEDIHAPATLEAVQAFDPMLGLSLAAPILRRPLFAIPPLGTLNLHKGRLPDYRGMPPAFWELWNDEREVGCSVHWVDDKLDTGAIAAETAVAREPHATLRGLQLRLDEVGVELMRQAVVEVLAGARPAAAQREGGRTYRKPTLAQAAALDRKLAGAKPPAQPAAERLVKSALGLALDGAWRLGLSRVVRPRITVLLYHRVTDAVRDNLSVGVEQFERQMSWLRRHCRVLAIEEVLECRRVPASREPLVCVTFDDGYLDNYLYAAPILLRHELPAAFFVSTGIVGTMRPFPHDVRRGNAPIPTLQWDQLRSLRRQGFTIGSHTVNHIDCAGEPEETVWAELTQSRDDLRRELGLGELILGYPYGGRQHMTQQRLDLVRQAGYVGCLSAYGGSNIGSVDRYNVLRRGIHWQFFDRAFARECMGLFQ